LAATLALDVVGRTVARVPVEEHMANYRAARALMGKGNSEKVRERGSSAKKGAKKSAVEHCAPALPVSETTRLEKACSLYPKVDVRYEKTAFSMRQLWECYTEAQHAMAISLRSITGDMIT
jgi:hypothetical protein